MVDDFIEKTGTAYPDAALIFRENLKNGIELYLRQAGDESPTEPTSCPLISGFKKVARPIRQVYSEGKNGPVRVISLGTDGH